MRKFLILLGITFLSIQSVYAENMTCSAAMKSSKPFIVLYTADYCTYCRRFKPVYKELYKSFNQKFNFVTINVEQRGNHGVCDSVRITGIPSLYIFNPKNGDRRQIPNHLYNNQHLIEHELDKYYASLN